MYYGDVWLTPIILFTLVFAWMLSSVDSDALKDPRVRLRHFLWALFGLSALWLWAIFD